MRATRVLSCCLLLASTAAPVAAKEGFRQLTHTYPAAVQRGTTSEVRLHSNFTLDGAHAVLFARPGITMSFLESKPIDAPRKGRGSKGTPFRFSVETPEDQLPGVYEYRVATDQSVSSCAQLLVTDFPVVLEQSEENGTPESAQSLSLPAAFCGVCEKFEDVDCLRFAGSAGQQVVLELFAQRVTDRLHGMVVRGPRIYLMDGILTLTGPNGQVVAQNDNFHGGDSFIACRLPQDGDYVLEIRDARFAGDPRYTYCVELSDRPHVHAAFPLAVQQGADAETTLIGEGIPDDGRTLQVSGDAPGWQLQRAATSDGPTNPFAVLISPHPQVIEEGDNDTPETAAAIALPCGVNGCLDPQDDADCYRFEAAKGQQFRFELFARRRGSPLDGVLELYDPEGKLIVEADDESALKTKDSRIWFTAPKDGEYVLAVRDLHGRGGERFVYHLQVEPSGPDFDLFGEYYYAMLAPGTRMMWFARIQRHNGFDGPVEITVEGLPAGVTAQPVAIPSGMDHCGIILSASDDAEIGAGLVKVRGRASVQRGDQTQEIVREGHVTCEQQGSGGGQARWPIETQIVGVTKPLDLARVTAAPQSVTLRRGEKVEIDVEIQRVDEFADAVTLDMAFTYFATVLGSQLPPGVTMHSSSKARLTGKVNQGKIVLEATDKAVQVKDFPIAVVARVSITFSITTNYASNPVLLTVE